MKIRRAILFGGLAAVLLCAPENGYDLFQKGLAKERADADPRAAIPFYERVLKEHAGNRKLAAEALFRIGECQHALGKEEARNTYERLVRDFADQREVVEQARARLAVLGKRSDAETLTVRRLWNVPRNALPDGVSPDGRFLAYASFFTTGDLAVRDLERGVSRHVTNKGTREQSADYAGAARFSPDGNRIAFGWRVPASREYQLRVIDSDGTNQKTVYTNPEAEWIGPVAWSPDGKQILVTIQTRNQAGQIAWIALATGSARVLKTVPWGALGRVGLSPDGGYIGYDLQTKDEPGMRTIFLLASDGSRESAVTDGSARDEFFGWLPDEKSILFATNRTGARELWALPVAHGKSAGAPVLVKPDIGQIGPLGITRAGSLLYSQYTSKGQLYLGSVDWESGRVAAQPIAQSRIPRYSPGWSPDGRHVAFVAHRGSQLSSQFIVIHSIETGEQREVVPKEGLNIRTNGGYQWSPDGKFFMVTGGHPKRGQGAYAIDVQTGNVRPLINRPGGHVLVPEWLPGGTAMIYHYADRLRTEGRAFIRDLSTGSDREILTGAERARHVMLAPSPDGRRLAFVPIPAQASGRTLNIMPLEGGTPRQLLGGGPKAPLWVIGWTPDSRRILFARATDSHGADVWWIAPEGGEPHRLEFDGRPPENPRFHPDGKRVAYIINTVEAEVWRMDNLLSALRNPR
jgi:Tol biopolymer transport system component